METSVGRGVGALVLALSLGAGCGAKKAAKPAESTPSPLCQPADECARGEPCGCPGMDPGCSCELCQLEGACHMTAAGSCQPTSDDDCKQPGGACSVYGFCHLVMAGGRPFCLAVSDDDCRSSLLCARWGACVFDQQLQQCFAGNADDCAGSEACGELGCCSWVGPECVRNDGTCPSQCCDGQPC